jgi:aminopeptidase N
VGEYRYDHFTVALVNASHAGGIEFPGLVALHSPRGGMLMTRLYESLVIHETVHQWFYGMIGSDQIGSPWMDESVTCFFTLKILEQYWGERANLVDLAGFEAGERDTYRAGARISPGLCRLNMPTHAFPGEEEYFATIYTKGPLIVETFDNLLGDSLSDIFWRRYFEENLFKRPGPEEFVDLASSIGGEHVRHALSVLLDEPVYLDLAVASLVNRRIDSVTYEAEVLLRKKGALPGPVDYRLILRSGDTLDYTWESPFDTEKMSFSLAAPVSAVIIDPHDRFTVDADLLNNSLSADGDSRPAMRISSGIMFLIESFLSFMGGM